MSPHPPLPIRRLGAAFALLAAGASLAAEGNPPWRSIAPVRPPLASPGRPLGEGPSFHAHPSRGDDANDGSLQKPWRTIGHALTRLRAGDTLCLGGGVYHERVSISLEGRPEAPITIRSAPGEQALVSGGFREFYEAPASAWEPAKGGAEGEYVSARPHPNARDVVGAFGDSFVGLQTYWHRADLAATNELWGTSGGKPPAKDPAKDPRVGDADIDPVYCGPGLWYDRPTGRIHVRLAPMRLGWPGVPNYRGEGDPRKLPLLVAPFASVPLHVDGASHVRFQDLTFAGSGYNAVVIDRGTGIEFDNVTVHCGTYGLVARNTIGFRFHNSALYGNIPPWGTRAENSLRARPGRATRDIARLTGHALLVADGHDEFSVYAHPFNRDWEISHSEFTDSHDGVYLGGVENLRFHHNVLDNCHDDGIYVSAVYPYGPQGLFIYQNRFSRVLTALAFGGLHPPRGPVHVYRNVFDLTGPVWHSRPTPSEPSPKAARGNLLGDHGSPQWAQMNIYQNTCVMSGERARYTAIAAASKERPRRVFNNLFLYVDGAIPKIYPAPAADADLQSDGNLFWAPGATPGNAAEFLAVAPRKARGGEPSPPPPAAAWEARSRIADPLLMAIDAKDPSHNDWRLRDHSPAIGAGVPLPPDWPDPLRPAGGKAPDVGALPAGSEPFQAGRLQP